MRKRSNHSPIPREVLPAMFAPSLLLSAAGCGLLAIVVSLAGFTFPMTVLAAAEVDFANDIVPIFTKLGCNSGACHGAAIGRGGFRLSLYGGDPDRDYESVVRELQGRRVNLSRADDSLILLKPTESIAHGGGYVIEDGDESAELLLRWISQGARNNRQRQLEYLEITPHRHLFQKVGESLDLRATAHYSDGSQADVTRWTVFTPEDNSAVEVDPETGSLTVLRRGRHIIVARYLSSVVAVEALVPLTDHSVDLSNEPIHNFIDEEILSTLEILALPVSPLVDQPTFVRRVTLDLTGRLPSPPPLQERDSNLQMPHADASSQAQRQELIDGLLQSDAFDQYWTFQLAKLLRIAPQPTDRDGMRAYHAWLSQQIRDNVGYDRLAAELILATGDSHLNGPANFYRTLAGPREQAEFFSELFMGSRLRCANCHNHPLDRWTQDDYHGLAAIFAKIEGGKVVRLNAAGELIHPRTQEPAIPRIPGQTFLSGAALEDGRTQLTNWLIDGDNPYFAKAIVNRIWKQLMGRGLVEPVDDFRDTNPATHPRLLDLLAADFVAHGYDLRHTLRLIASSSSYARSSQATPANRDDDRFYSHALRPPLEAEVLADAIADVLGVSEIYGELPRGTRAVSLINPKTPSTTLDVLGRCGRDESCEQSTGAAGGLTQKLHLFNGGLLNARIGAPGGRLDKLLSNGRDSLEIVDYFYLTALNRHPTGEELEYWKVQLRSVHTALARQELLEDFVWSLVTCSEFVHRY